MYRLVPCLTALVRGVIITACISPNSDTLASLHASPMKFKARKDCRTLSRRSGLGHLDAVNLSLSSFLISHRFAIYAFAEGVVARTHSVPRSSSPCTSFSLLRLFRVCYTTNLPQGPWPALKREIWRVPSQKGSHVHRPSPQRLTEMKGGER